MTSVHMYEFNIFNETVTTWGNVSRTVRHCYSSHIRCDGAVKELKKGDLFPEYTLMSRGTRLSPLCFLTEHLYQDAAHISAVMVVFIRQVAL